jgi:hypothetical protein
MCWLDKYLWDKTCEILNIWNVAQNEHNNNAETVVNQSLIQVLFILNKA